MYPPDIIQEDMTTTTSQPFPHPSLTSLPPELLDQITTHLPTASTLRSLDLTSHYLHNFIQTSGWRTFTLSRFPTLATPAPIPPTVHDARSLTGLSKAMDRLSMSIRWIEPSSTGAVTAYPGRTRMARWAPSSGGQTIGFAPRIDVVEDDGGAGGRRKEVLAFSTGAGIAVRESVGGSDGSGGRRNRTEWMTYRPAHMQEGLDDVTTLHIVRSEAEDRRRMMIVGRANGALQMLRLPDGKEHLEFGTSNLQTKGGSVWSSSILQTSKSESLLAAAIGDANVALYNLGPEQQSKYSPIDTITIPPIPTPHRTRSMGTDRVRTIRILNPTTLAISVGVTDTPVQLFSLTPTGIDPTPTHRIPLTANAIGNDSVDQLGQHTSTLPPVSSVFALTPLPHNDQVFLSGAHDSAVRLHDLRSPRGTVYTYTDPIEDSPVYNLLPHGADKVLVGTGRHNLVKVFDLRFDGRRYDWMGEREEPEGSCDLSRLYFSTGHAGREGAAGRGIGRGAGRGAGRGGGQRPRENRGNTRGASVYALAAASPRSPTVYVGMSDVVKSVTWTDDASGFDRKARRGEAAREDEPLQFPLGVVWVAPKDRMTITS